MQMRNVSLGEPAPRAAAPGVGVEYSGRLGLAGGSDVDLVDGDHEDRAGATPMHR
jgi:hypothetical protein